MNIFSKFSAYAASVILTGVALSACNKDDVIETDSLKPIIILDNEYGVYTVKVGHKLTIAPKYENADDASFTWTLDDKVVGHEREWTATWTTIGEYYATVAVTNRAGSASEDMRIDVLELTPPVISLPLPEGGLKIKASTDYTFQPDILHADMDDFEIRWFVNGTEEGRNMTFTFNRTEPGIYQIKIEASNIDGSSEKTFDVEVIEGNDYRVAFSTPSYFITSTDRYTFPGRPVFLRPIIADFTAPTFTWQVDGVDTDCTDNKFKFTPVEPGEYSIKVIVSDSEGEGSAATVKVVCVNASEADRIRQRTASSSPYSDKVYEWVPAPGQFINDTSIFGGMTGAESSPEAANEWAQTRLSSRQFVSLGAFGGYIITGFDHSITPSGAEYDLAIGGNAYLSANGGSNEPGIVWVMQDVNGNGLPDDEWYELRSSEYDNPQTNTDYSVTYFRPEAPGMDVDWIDSEDKTGKVKYLSLLHKQDYYYPAWIESSDYTLYGTRIPENNSVNPTTGYWNNAAYPWGYADNIGSDNLGGETADGDGQRNGFKIANAVYPDGTNADLGYIDFVKVQVAVMAQSGTLGEISTEVTFFQDISYKQ